MTLLQILKNHGLRCIWMCLLILPFSSWHVSADVMHGTYAYTVLGPDQQALLRSITSDSSCPAGYWNNGNPIHFEVRSHPTLVPARPDQAQSEQSTTDLRVLVCETTWPHHVTSAQVGGRWLQGPRLSYSKILILGDSGCRLKASENAFQDCNDPRAWPFPVLTQVAAAMQPDLVVHIGDLHYRESPCPAKQSGCAESTWGYGWPAWRSDFFEPAYPLLQVPWIWVRGNHESCARAGQGWMRFLDPRPFHPHLSCDDPLHDAQADFTPPYQIALNDLTRLWVFDSSKASGKSPSQGDPVVATHQRQLQTLQAASTETFNVFLSHHPYTALVQTPKGQLRETGTTGLKSALHAAFGDNLLPPQFQLSLHGHLHFFEALLADPGRASTMILGNSGSMMEAMPAGAAPENQLLAHGTRLKQLVSHAEFGFAMLTHQTNHALSAWRLTEFNAQGQALFECQLSPSKASCLPMSPIQNTNPRQR